MQLQTKQQQQPYTGSLGTRTMLWKYTALFVIAATTPSVSNPGEGMLNKAAAELQLLGSCSPLADSSCITPAVSVGHGCALDAVSAAVPSIPKVMASPSLTAGPVREMTIAGTVVVPLHTKQHEGGVSIICHHVIHQGLCVNVTMPQLHSPRAQLFPTMSEPWMASRAGHCS
jgi:hypothetical protein